MNDEAENIRIRHVTSGNAYCAGEKVVYHILPFYPLLLTLINMYVCMSDLLCFNRISHIVEAETITNLFHILISKYEKVLSRFF